MELRQLQYLLDVVEEASFTKAAARAHVAQPGVSAQIRRLERELGQTLLDRSGATVRPTAAGEAILSYARAALASVAAIRQTADALAGLVRGHLHLGVAGWISSPQLDLPGVLAGFHHDHPGIEITLTDAPSDQLLADLRAGRIEVALIGLGPRPPADDIAIRILATEPVAVAVSPDHPLAGRTTIRWDALRDQPVITLPRGTGLRARLDEACAATGVRLRVAVEVGDPRLAAQLAANGLGAAVLPASVIEDHPSPLRLLTLTRPRASGRIALAWRADRPASPATRAFLQYADPTSGAVRASPGPAATPPDRLTLDRT